MSRFIPNDYATSITISKIVSAVGWGITAISILILLGSIVGTGAYGLLALAPSLLLFVAGLLLVVAGQISRAVFDNTNYSKQMLHIMRTSEETRSNPGFVERASNPIVSKPALQKTAPNFQSSSPTAKSTKILYNGRTIFVNKTATVFTVNGQTFSSEQAAKDHMDTL